MSKPPFGFGLPGPDKGDGDDSGGDAFQQLGQMLSQLGQMLSQTGGSSGPVNYDLAKQIAEQQLGKDTSMGFTTSEDAGSQAVRDSAHLAELWLDAATIHPAGASTTLAWTARQWVDQTMPTWKRLCDPVAEQVSNAWMHALPDEAKQAAGPLLSMVSQMGGMAFGSQLGNALAGLASEVLTSTDVGLPLGPSATSALLPTNIDKFAEGLERPRSEVLVFLAAREAAHQRLFAHVPWLRQRLLATVEEFASGISVDTSALEDLASRVDPSNPASIEEAMSSGLLEPKTSPEQQVALTRLETLLALVEGWVDVVVADAVGERLPGADALRETLRRRRATGGPAEQTFATLVGLELRPRRMREASTLWQLVGEQHGIQQRDQLWSHPDLIPTAEDLEDPARFADQLGADTATGVDFDPIAELKRTERHERGEGEEDGADEGTNDRSDGSDDDAGGDAGPTSTGPNG